MDIDDRIIQYESKIGLYDKAKSEGLATDAVQDERYNQYQKMQALDRDMKAEVHVPPKDWIPVADVEIKKCTQ